MFKLIIFLLSVYTVAVKGQQCPGNQTYNKCGSPCRATCDSDLSSQICQGKCESGCFCNEGYVLNKEKECILLKDCPGQKCPANETYSNCGTACPATCDNTPQACTEQCVAGCFCDSGYVRNSEKKCILRSECPGKCSEHQTYKTCGTACPETCENYFKPQICTKQCVKGCFCDPGYVLDKEKNCVLTSKCPEPKCPPTQKFNPCGSACPLTCANYKTPMVCALQCVPRCSCEPNYVLNTDTQECVPPEKCPGVNKTCPVGEIYSTCDNPCLPSCEIPNTTNCNFLLCNEGCVCRPPLIRHLATGKCIERKFCPVSCNDENAEQSKCAPKCPETCQHKYTEKCSKECSAGCICKNGYTKDELNGNCVSNKICPSLKCGRNEEYNQCGTKCPKTCANRGALIKCIAGCQAGCFCKDGYVRDEKTGRCVNPEKCPASVKCGPNETYASEGIDCATCSNYAVVRCPLIKEYKCYCLSGYVRDDITGKCILVQDCPKGKCGANETFATEGIDCATCSNYKVVRCAVEHEEKCYCLSGYVREDITRRCVSPQDCPQEQCKKPNEEYVPCAPGPCEPTCQHTEPQVCTLECRINGCKCKEGFLRDNVTRDCVPKEKCP